MSMFFCNYLYKWFNFLYSKDMDDYLAGYSAATNTYYNFHQVGYPMLGGISIALAVVTALVYYYAINRASMNRWYHWCIAGLVAGVVNFLVAFILTNDAFQAGDIYAALCDGSDGQCGIAVGMDACAMVGLSNFIIAFLIYFVASMLVKWWSTNCRRTPF